MTTQENPDWVRVKDTRTGHEITVARRVAHKDYYEILDKPAVNRSGRPLDSKPLKNLEPIQGREETATVQETTMGSNETTPPAAPAPGDKPQKGGRS